MDASALHAPSAAGAHPAGRARLLRLRTDEQLLDLFRDGSEDAFAVIVDRYETRLLAYTRRMLGGSRQDAEDALQDVFLRAYGALRADRRPVSVRAWLYRVAHNRCIDQVRRTPPAAPDVLAVTRGCDRDDPQRAAERRETLATFVADVEALPAAQRSALLMRELEGLSYAELCATLDLSLPAVKSLLVRARTGLAEAGEARAVPCAVIRAELDEGGRPDARARRHLRECAPCRAHRVLDGAPPAGAHAAHAGPLGLLMNLLGMGGGPAAGGGAVLTGGSAVSAKVAALVCCGVVAAGAGAASELPRATTGHARPAPAAARAAHPTAAGALAPRRATAPGAVVGSRNTAAPAAPRPVHRPAPADPAAGPVPSGDGTVAPPAVLPPPVAGDGPGATPDPAVTPTPATDPPVSSPPAGTAAPAAPDGPAAEPAATDPAPPTTPVAGVR